MTGTVEERLVLVVEDNLVNQKVITAMLARLGYSLDVVADGKQALDALGEKRYDIIFMDCQMPVMDGYEATKRIRLSEEGAGERIPIIAMTANVLEEDKKLCFAAGMDDFLAKPVMLDTLNNMIRKWCPERESNPRPSP